MIFDVKKIDKRKLELQKAKDNLKAYFIGLDSIIDDIFSNLEIWYIMPELLTNPIVINLWGMTGVGKTDLVRRLVKELEMTESYLEVQMDTGTDNSYNTDDIYSSIKRAGILSTEKSVVLLDEMQRFRTIDEDGDLIENSKYQDIWMLLSDGKFYNDMNKKQHLHKYFLNMLYEKEEFGGDERPLHSNKKGKKKVPEYKTSVWLAEELRTLLEVNDSIEEIMKWSPEDILKTVEEKLDDIHEISYSKMLIFISGNIDEAYSMSKDVSEVSMDADILHAFSKKINILRIKECLLKKFKPEQIARFGNNHIIYPSLSKSNFKDLINKKLTNIQERVKDSFNIDIIYDESVNRAIYKNGVYPSQGVRPLFSTVTRLVESSLPSFLYQLVINTQNKLELFINEKKSIVYGAIKGNLLEKQVKLDLEDLEKEVTDDDRFLTVVHECGHFVAYSALTELLPLQININSISNSSSGFIMPHRVNRTKTELDKEVMICLAGLVAEEIVFGKDNRGIGSQEDRERATTIIAKRIRKYGMEEWDSILVGKNQEGADYFCNETDRTSHAIECYFSSLKKQTETLLKTNMDFFKKAVESFAEKREIKGEELLELVREFIPNIQMKSSDHEIMFSYKKKALDFLEDK